MALQTILPWLAFQVVWLACAIDAASGHGWFGLAAALMFTAAMLARSPQAARDTGIVVASGIAGFGIESALIGTGLIRFAAPWPVTMLAPAWIVALWMAFGATLPALDQTLGTHRLKIATILGAVAGPLSYIAGARLGALQIVGPTTTTLLALSAAWAIILPGLMLLVKRR
jgi:hypothetical protein